MAKMPFMKFYPSDWLRDTRGLSPQAKSVWIDVLAMAWNEPKRGVYERPISVFLREHNLDDPTCADVLEELAIVCTVTFVNKKVTITSRRMVREENTRESTKFRVQEFRKRQSNENVTDKKLRSQKSEAKKLIKETTPLPPSKGELLIPEDLKNSEAEIKDWLEYKRQKGQTYKAKGLEALWRTFRAIPAAARRAAVDQSMANNWAGLFTPKFSQPDKKDEVVF